VNTNSFYSADAEENNKNFLMTYKPAAWVNLFTGQSLKIEDWSKDKIIYAIAGIGNPSSFFSLLRSLSFHVVEKIFPDHHEFIESDFNQMEDLPIVMTEKDAIKCKFLKNPNCWYLKIESNLSDDFQSQILEKISI
jgi:tetraacyldisaccharide 4'-kinase